MPVAVVVAVDLQERLAAINADNKKQKRNMAAGGVAGGIHVAADNNVAEMASDQLAATATQFDTNATDQLADAVADTSATDQLADAGDTTATDQLADNIDLGAEDSVVEEAAEDEATGQAEGLAGDAEVQADTPNAETPEVPEVDTSCIKDAVMGVVGLYSKASEKIKILFTYVQMMSSFPGESLLHLATLSMLTSLNTLTSLPSLIGPLCCRHN